MVHQVAELLHDRRANGPGCSNMNNNMGHQIEKDDKGSAQAAVAWNRFQIAVEQKSIRREKSFQRIQNLNVLLIGADRFPPKKIQPALHFSI